jgi:hypothetical protein
MPTTIPLPPDGPLHRGGSGGTAELTVVFDGPACVADSLTFIVADEGFLVRFPGGLFKRDIPVGVVKKGAKVGPLIPQVSVGSVIAGYLDFGRKTLYVIPIQIKSSCP